MTKPPNPGSKEALDMGCLCPVMDNHAGKGFRQDADGGMLFWITGDCPLHGKPKPIEELANDAATKP